MTAQRRLQDLLDHVSKTARITFQDPTTGHPDHVTHDELIARAICVARDLVDTDARLDPDQDRAILIDGKPSLGWITAAFASMMSGHALIAFPETIHASNIAQNIPPLSIAHVFADDPARWPNHSARPMTSDAVQHRGASDGTVDIPFRFNVIAFTSGTTSENVLKSFKITSDSTELLAFEFTRRFNLGPGDNWAVCHSFSHIVHFEYVLACLLYGIDLDISTTPDLIQQTRRIAPSAVVTVPAVYEQLVRVVENEVKRSRKQRLLWQAASRLPDAVLSSRRTRQLLRVLLPLARQRTGGQLKVLILGAAPSTHSLKRRLASLGLPVYEAYGMTELGMISCQAPGNTRLGTVGRAWPGLDVRINDDRVLTVRPQVSRASGYLHGHNGVLLFDNDGVAATGDLAEIDSDGNITIIGRQKSLIITDRAKNINPVHIADRLGTLPGVFAAVPYGNGRPYLTAVLFLHPGSAAVQDDELVALNGGAAMHEHVRGLVQTSLEPTMENQLLTRSGKINDGQVHRHFAAELEALYAAPPA